MLGEGESVGRHGYRYVVMPSWIASTFIVVEAENALHVLIQTLRPPAVHVRADDFDMCRLLRERGEKIVWLFGFIEGLLRDEP